MRDNVDWNKTRMNENEYLEHCLKERIGRKIRLKDDIERYLLTSILLSYTYLHTCRMHLIYL